MTLEYLIAKANILLDQIRSDPEVKANKDGYIKELFSINSELFKHCGTFNNEANLKIKQVYKIIKEGAKTLNQKSEPIILDMKKDRLNFLKK